MWKDKPLNRETLFWGQCSQKTDSPAYKTGRTESSPTKRESKKFEWNCSNCSGKIEPKVPSLHSGAAINSLKSTQLPPIPEINWKQSQETHVVNIHENSTTETPKITHTPELKQRIDIESHTSPIRETSPQVIGSDTEPLLENPTRSTPVQCLNDSQETYP